MTNANLPRRAEVLRDGPAPLPDWLQMHVPHHDPVDYVRLIRPVGSGGELNFKHRTLAAFWGCWRHKITATDWKGMVREAIGILERERER